MLQQTSIEVFIDLPLTGGEKSSANRTAVAYINTITPVTSALYLRLISFNHKREAKQKNELTLTD